MAEKHKLDLSGVDRFVDQFILDQAEYGLQAVGKKIAASASKNVSRSKRRAGRPVRFAYYPVPNSRTVPTSWINRETGAVDKAWASDVRSKLGSTEDLGVVRQWKIEAYAQGARGGPETVYPVEQVRFTKRTNRAVTGKHLADSIEVRDGGAGKRVWVDIVANRPYAYYVEKGVGKGGEGKGGRARNRGFMERALAEHVEEILAGNVFGLKGGK